MTTRALSVFRPMLCVAVCAAAATATFPARAAEDSSPMMNVVELSGKGAVQVQQDMLDRMNRYADLASGPAVRPAAPLGGNAPAQGIGASFEQALRSVDA